MAEPRFDLTLMKVRFFQDLPQIFKGDNNVIVQFSFWYEPRR